MVSPRIQAGGAALLTEASLISPEFLITSTVVVLLPGTGAIYTVSTGLGAKLALSDR